VELREEASKPIAHPSDVEVPVPSRQDFVNAGLQAECDKHRYAFALDATRITSEVLSRETPEEASVTVALSTNSSL
jgi:hypothetical protein